MFLQRRISASVKSARNLVPVNTRGGFSLKKSFLLRVLGISIAVISLNFLCDDAFADPWIMPGAVDITDATEIEDYIPEVETIAYYDEYGMPRNENGDIIGSMWCYDPETELYCIYSNEGELTNQKEYPYDISDMELGELDIRLSYRKNYAINPGTYRVPDTRY